MNQFFSSATLAALISALLFGASTPFAKLLVGEMPPILLAGLLYLGSGIGLGIIHLLRYKNWHRRLSIKELGWLSGAIFFGGILSPILLMLGLTYLNAGSASLLLNFESVLTAVLAWIFFKEHTDKRIMFGMFLIVVGGIILSWSKSLVLGNGSLAIVAACLCWAIDNNLTRKISSSDALFIAGSKGFISGVVNISLAFSLGIKLPSWTTVNYALLLGFFSYGVSLLLFVLALRGLGTARASAYFSTAPFIGAAIAIVFFHEPTSVHFWIAAVLMAIGVWIHLSEYHDHVHTHEALFHSHAHVHDEHHQHDHNFPWDGKEPHTHPHQHEPITHSHHHYPDIHHRHKH